MVVWCPADLIEVADIKALRDEIVYIDKAYWIVNDVRIANVTFDPLTGAPALDWIEGRSFLGLLVEPASRTDRFVATIW